jgi:hypothetical protein
LSRKGKNLPSHNTHVGTHSGFSKMPLWAF